MMSEPLAPGARSDAQRSHAIASVPTASPRRSKPSLRALQKELTRQRIMESALVIFERKGFISTTLEDIASHGEISRPTIYQHFGSKAAILQAVVAELPELRPVLQAILAARDRAARRAGFTALNDYWHEHLGRVWRLVREATAVDTEVTEWIKQFFREQRAMIQAELERCGVPASDASARAFLVWCSWHEYVYQLDAAADLLDADVFVDALTDQFEAATRPRNEP